jgi:predicted ferric reductase
VIAVASGKALWYATRGSGAVTLILLSLSFLLGVVTLVGWSSKRLSMLVLQLLHRNVSLLVLVFLAIHIVTTVADSYAPIHWIDAVVPFNSPYRTLWLGLGTIATDLLLAIIISSLLRVRIGAKTWRAIHYSSYLVWPLSAVHGWKTGSDRHHAWMLWVDAITLVLAAGAVVWRLVARRPQWLNSVLTEPVAGRAR